MKKKRHSWRVQWQWGRTWYTLHSNVRTARRAHELVAQSKLVAPMRTFRIRKIEPK